MSTGRSNGQLPKGQRVVTDARQQRGGIDNIGEADNNSAGHEPPVWSAGYVADGSTSSVVRELWNPSYAIGAVKRDFGANSGSSALKSLASETAVAMYHSVPNLARKPSVSGFSVSQSSGICER